MRELPCGDSASLRGLWRMIQENVELYCGYGVFMDALTAAKGVVTGSVANYVAFPSIPLSPVCMDVVVPFHDIDPMVNCLTAYSYRYTDEEVVAPWKGTAHSVYLFVYPRRRNHTPAPEKTIHIIRCRDLPHAVYRQILSSPSTHKTTFFSPSGWVTFYPLLYEGSRSWDQLECNSDEIMGYKLGWLKRLGLNCVSAVLLRPLAPPTLVPLPIEPNAIANFSLENGMVELWFQQPLASVWSLETSITTVEIEGELEEGQSVFYSVYALLEDHESFEEGFQYHQSSLLIMKHNNKGFLSFKDSDLRT
ncbi:hypothetical protein K435DRAFT_850776 [Dendrothele bispora CBS 962.96]|uniref:Uncharacterized protein n=1 Tax=Dendrothele bispora (strain CBS 962.96) TaxID=1314807 RepID=A0A4S8MQD1_DENBC|nr:hypothetical protein K435DRAFT_850776 [Dendrothele bispora CBS 962.96]